MMMIMKIMNNSGWKEWTYKWFVSKIFLKYCKTKIGGKRNRFKLMRICNDVCKYRKKKCLGFILENEMEWNRKNG